MSRPPYRASQVALRIFFVLLAIGALFMIFSSRALVVRVFLDPPGAEVSTLVLFLTEGDGWNSTHGQRDAVSCLPRSGAQPGYC